MIVPVGASLLVVLTSSSETPLADAQPSAAPCGWPTKSGTGGPALTTIRTGCGCGHMPPAAGVVLTTMPAAQAALRHAGLTPGAVAKETSSTIPAGIVVSTTPAAGGMWPQPQPVRMVVSAGPPVPDFVGQPQGAAEGWASANGVSLDEVSTTKSDAPTGTITRQSLPPGSAFTPGQVIIITISAGPPQVAIPNVDGMSVDHATHTLEKAGFSVQVNQVGPLDNVFNYSPNTQAPKGSTITIWVGL